MGLKLITGPASEPITTAEAKAHLRVDGADDDAYIGALIAAARQGAEHITGRALMPQTWEATFERFSCALRLPNPPLVSVASVKYLDGAGALQTIDPAIYEINDYAEPVEIRRAHGATWPATLCHENAVVVRYACGYANAAAVPQEIKAWMLLRIGLLYGSREPVVIGAPVAEMPFVDRLLDAHKIWGF
ncbi:MAG: phage head-tail connector protein [Burkholderiaceae bacterium]|nr:phage head-tail connector protein [Burkholderiaceae bacterium]